MQKSTDTYWSLVIESGYIQSAIWDIDSTEKKAKVLSVSSAARWESDEDLVTAADSVLSSAVSELPDEVEEPSKTVFGVSASWVEGGQIKEEFIEKIRRVCSSLSLEPSGFVVLPEAIAYFIKANEGSPLSGIVVGIGVESLEISVFKLGNLLGNVTVSRSVSIADDVLEGLVRFKVEDNLPSRILVFDGKEGQLEEAKQSLVSVDWKSPEIEAKVKFLHIPKVEIVEPKDKVLAVCLAGASEIGQVSEVSFAGREEEAVETPEVIPEIEKNFDETDITPEELGFVAGADIRSVAQIPQNIEQEPPSYNSPRPNLPGLPKMPKVNIKMPNLKLPGFSMPRLPKIHLPKNGPAAAVGAFVALLVVGFMAWFFLPKATVTVYVSPKQIDSTQNITLDSSITQRQESVTVSGSKSVSVTGTKTVGDPAKGQVTIYNAGDTVSLPSGTKVTGPSGLVFTTDSDTQVASGSGLLNLGTSTAAVTSSDIGPDFNLAGGTTFTVGNFASNELTAKNDNAFSGGSSRDITAVSASDLKKAEDAMTSQLKDDGLAKLQTKISSDDFLIDGSVTATPSAKTFDHKVGDEASNLNLSMDVDATGTVISKSDLTKMAVDALRSKIPTGFVLRPSQITADFSLVSGKKYKVKFAANLLPEVKTDDITKSILGKKPADAEAILALIPGYARSVISGVPHLGPLTSLPHLAKNIDLEISSDK